MDVPNDGLVILIAERDRTVRELQEYFLSNAGLVVRFADDGQVAFDLARELLPALVVTEILIPAMDGLALCRRLGEDPLTRHIPVIIFSLLTAAQRAEEAGAAAFLRKPLVQSVFVSAVQRLLAAQPPANEERWISP